MKSRSWYRVTAGGWGLLAACLLLGVGALNAALNMLYLLVSLLLSLLVAGLIGPLWATYGLDYRRARRGDAYAGEPIKVDLWIYSRRRAAAHHLSIEEPLGGRATEGADKEPRPAVSGARAKEDARRKNGPVFRRFVPYVAPGAHVAVTCALPPRRRGVYPLPGMQLSSSFPFGLAERGIMRSGTGELLVYPARGELAEDFSASLLPADGREGVPARTGLLTNEFRSVREYRPGDNLRSIHWRATAHHGELCVKETDRERTSPVVVALDSRVPGSTPREYAEAAWEALERAISFAAEVCRAALERGNSARLVALFPEPREIAVSAPGRNAQGAGAAGDAAMTPILEALARLNPSTEETAESFDRAFGRSRREAGTRVIGVTPTRVTAPSFRATALGRRAELHVVDSAAFAAVFSLRQPDSASSPVLSEITSPQPDSAP